MNTSRHRLLVGVLALCACDGGDSEPGIDCPSGSDGRELVADDGSVERWCARADGVMAGPYRSTGPDGVDRVRGRYVNDAADGEWQWLEDGVVVQAGSYRGGVACGTWRDRGDEIELVACDTLGPAVVEAPARDEGELVDGARDGVWKSYLGDGTLVAEVSYVAGVREGAAKTFHDNGERACAGVYRDDLRDGAWTCWHDNGALASNQAWRRGVVSGTWETFDREARPLSVGDYDNGAAQGRWSIWLDIGYFGTLALRAKRSGEIRNGRPEGAWAGVWDQAGQPKESELVYVAGLREGPWKQWWPNGQLGVEGHFFTDLVHGRWKTYSDTGVLSVDEGYTLGVLDGDYADYYDDGAPKSRGRYRSMARVGVWTYWDADGNSRTESCDDWGHCT